uniref:Uncharacterized protein n=1 Tax=Branchiostoma floridae TaxID=7739 RepID=C3XU01_BRAFL|eukprot:XP_002612366.1 hypothetical protein BRAFLDRAFT_79980 [Branchiostoma floridae]
MVKEEAVATEEMSLDAGKGMEEGMSDTKDEGNDCLNQTIDEREENTKKTEEEERDEATRADSKDGMNENSTKEGEPTDGMNEMVKEEAVATEEMSLDAGKGMEEGMSDTKDEANDTGMEAVSVTFEEVQEMRAKVASIKDKYDKMKEENERMKTALNKIDEEVKADRADLVDDAVVRALSRFKRAKLRLAGKGTSKDIAYLYLAAVRRHVSEGLGKADADKCEAATGEGEVNTGGGYPDFVPKCDVHEKSTWPASSTSPHLPPSSHVHPTGGIFIPNLL